MALWSWLQFSSTVRAPSQVRCATLKYQSATYFVRTTFLASDWAAACSARALLVAKQRFGAPGAVAVAVAVVLHLLYRRRHDLHRFHLLP
jgi:hypothetical protein